MSIAEKKSGSIVAETQQVGVKVQDMLPISKQKKGGRHV